MKYVICGLVIFVSMLLISCGQYGELYLPSHSTGVNVHDHKEKKIILH